MDYSNDYYEVYILRVSYLALHVVAWDKSCYRLDTHTES